jgi:hypothetical protein
MWSLQRIARRPLRLRPTLPYGLRLPYANLFAPGHTQDNKRGHGDHRPGNRLTEQQSGERQPEKRLQQLAVVPTPAMPAQG